MISVEEYLEKIPLWADKKNSLESIRDFLREMGNPDDCMRIIHVAGTNGKGSVCQYLTSVLCQAGFRVGTFVSPHLEDVRERFLICGKPVERESFERAFGQVRKLSEEMTGRGYAPPTYFEFLFYMFMAMMKEFEPDFVVLETGLGGRLDVTNVVRKPVLTVLTSISMDHMQYLGDTIEKIAAEKAGILKHGVPVVYDASCPDSRRVIEEKAVLLGCLQVPVRQEDYTFVKREERGTWIQVRTKSWGELSVGIPSQAEYQMMNGAVAVKALDVLVEEVKEMLEDSGRHNVQEMWEGGSQTENSGRQNVRRNKEGGSQTENSSIQDFRSLLEGWREDRGACVIQGIRGSYWPGRMEQVLEGVYRTAI